MGHFDEFVYVALIFGLFVVPRALERFYMPSGITAFLFGLITTATFGVFKDDASIALLATLGINALFLFAGLEANLTEIRNNLKIVLAHVLISAIVLGLVSLGVHRLLGLTPVVSVLYALALTTPSAGFILDSISTLPLTEERKFWVKTKGIATELLALGLMFVLLQSHSATALATSSLGLAMILVAIPFVFRLVSRFVTPYAEHSEFGFFLTLAVLAGILTKKLGAYYLVGAFIVGISVQRFQSLFPKMDVERMLHSLKLFSSFFIPFYFFRAGGKVSLEHFSLAAIGLGIALAAVVSGIRVFSVAVSRSVAFGEKLRESVPVGAALVPTLVFGLVIAEVLHEKHGLPSLAFGALIVHTLLVTIVPGILLRNRRIQDVPEPYELLSER